MTGAIFLDRDGTINEKAPPHQHVTTREQFHFLPGVLDALAFLAQNSGRKIVIATNQSCIGRKTATQENVDDLNAWMMEQIHSAGGRINALYCCPHTPDDGCLCRKPAPGMLRQAALDLSLSLGRSVMVGDAASDLLAGWAAGLTECYQVMTGAPLESIPGHEGHYAIYATLEDAARAIVENEHV